MAENPRLTPGPKDALVVVDVQNDFCPGGRLAVQKGDEVVPLINELARRFENVVLTQDWHPSGHLSFATSHPGTRPFDSIKLPYGEQVLWPDHCVQGSDGAALHKDLAVPHAQLVVRKGWRREVDSYSAFVEADRKSRTGLEGYLDELGIKRLLDRKSTRLNSSHLGISYAVFCLKKKKKRMCKHDATPSRNKSQILHT